MGLGRKCFIRTGVLAVLGGIILIGTIFYALYKNEIIRENISALSHYTQDTTPTQSDPTEASARWKFYLYSYTNVDALYNLDASTPSVIEVGPFVYDEQLSQINRQFVNTPTRVMDFLQKRNFHYVASESLPESTSVTSLWTGYLRYLYDNVEFRRRHLRQVLEAVLTLMDSNFQGASQCVSTFDCRTLSIKQWSNLGPNGGTSLRTALASSLETNDYPDFAGWARFDKQDASLQLTDAEGLRVLNGTHGLLRTDTTGDIGIEMSISPSDTKSQLAARGVSHAALFLRSRDSPDASIRALYTSKWGISATKAAAIAEYLTALGLLAYIRMSQDASSVYSSLSVDEAKLPFVSRSASSILFNYEDPLLSAVGLRVNSALFTNHSSAIGDSTTTDPFNAAKMPGQRNFRLSAGPSNRDEVGRVLSFNGEESVADANVAGIGAYCSGGVSVGGTDGRRFPPCEADYLLFTAQVGSSSILKTWSPELMRQRSYHYRGASTLYGVNVKEFDLSVDESFGDAQLDGTSFPLANLTCPAGYPLHVSLPHFYTATSSGSLAGINMVSGIDAPSKATDHPYLSVEAFTGQVFGHVDRLQLNVKFTLPFQDTPTLFPLARFERTYSVTQARATKTKVDVIDEIDWVGLMVLLGCGIGGFVSIVCLSIIAFSSIKSRMHKNDGNVPFKQQRSNIDLSSMSESPSHRGHDSRRARLQQDRKYDDDDVVDDDNHDDDGDEIQ
jgi:CD36 family